MYVKSLLLGTAILQVENFKEKAQLDQQAFELIFKWLIYIAYKKTGLRESWKLFSFRFPFVAKLLP